MSIRNFAPTIWSSRILSRLNDELVFGNVCNRDYEGEIRAYGDTVKINEIGPVTIRSYTRGSTSDITWEFLTDAQKELKIDQARYFAFEMEDIDKAQNLGAVMAEATDEAMWGLRNAIDEAIAAKYTEAGITVIGTSSSSGQDIASHNVIRAFSYAQHKLDEANVPQAGRWMVVPPWFAAKMALAGIIRDTNNSGILANGRIPGQFFGFNVSVSNNVSGGTPAADNARILCGYSGTISLAVQLLNVEAVRPAKQFVDLVKGLCVYGIKVVRPSTLGVMYVDYTAESSVTTTTYGI
jgi:hypothetical protein